MFYKIASFSLTFFAFSSSPSWGSCETHLHVEKAKACSVSSLNENFSKEIAFLQQNSTEKTEKLLSDKDFQEVVAQLRSQDLGNQKTEIDGQEKHKISDIYPDPKSLNPASCYVFVSFSLGEKALLQLAMDAKHYGAILVLRGFRDESYIKTAQSLQKIIQKTGQGFLIDPELFSLFDIQAVPTFVLAKPFSLDAGERRQTPLHDRLQGHVSFTYVLETFAQQGDLKSEAQALLKQRKTRNKQSNPGEEK